MHDVLIEKRAEKDLNNIPSDHFQKIITILKRLANNPRPQGCKKLAGSKSDWRIRVGVYRILYEINDRENKVRIMRVRHRREVYR